MIHDESELSWRTLAALLDARGEWLCAERRDGATVPLRRGEWELTTRGRRAHFAYWTERGVRVWRLLGWARAGAGLRLMVARRMGAERATLELVPRASVQAGVEAIRAARLRLCAQLAQQACAHLAAARIEQVRLSAGARRREPGRYARIILMRARGEPLAVTGPVVALKAGDADALLVSALGWWLRLNRRARYAALRKLWLVVPRELVEALGQRLALLRAEVREDITLYARAETEQALTPVSLPELAQVLTVAPRALASPRHELSMTAARVVALAPAEIDVVRARHGETLRFRGLAFARVRSVLGREHLWFGVGARRLLDEHNWPALARLLDELATHRRFAPPDPRHLFYRAAPEAWLEALLRRDITRLDPGLRLAPLHAQFRPQQRTPGGARPVDLLALRRDGRLVVIELKVTEDAALPLQGADYWRRVSAHQRAGHIERARLFGDAEITNDAPLVYLVAPIFRFHRAFHTLARCLTPEIEMYRFDLNEDWRVGVRVVRRARVNKL